MNEKEINIKRLIEQASFFEKIRGMYALLKNIWFWKFGYRKLPNWQQTNEAIRHEKLQEKYRYLKMLLIKTK